MLITRGSVVRVHNGPPSKIIGALAQLGERGLCKPEVRGSIPLCSTKFSTAVRRSFLCIGGSNPARVEQPSGLFKPEHGGSRAQGSVCPEGIRPIPLCSTKFFKRPIGPFVFIIEH